MAAVANVIRTQGAADPTRSALINVLSAVGTREAQDAMAELIRSPSHSRELRAEALSALSRVEVPEAFAREAITSLVDDPVQGNNALLALGSIARRYRDSGQQGHFDAIHHELARRLEASKRSAQELSTTLRAVSNSGDSRFFAEVAEYHKHQNPTVRSAAIAAIRHMDDPRAPTALLDLLKQERDRLCLFAILNAIKKLEPSQELFAGLEALLKRKDLDHQVAQRVVELMEAWRKSAGPTLSMVGPLSGSN